MLLTQALESRAKLEQLALIEEASAETLSYADLYRRLGQVAGLLHAHGVRPGEIVSLVSDNSLDFAVNLLGGVCFGAIVNPIAPDATPLQLRTIVTHAESRLILSQQELPLWENAPACTSTSAYRQRKSRTELLLSEGNPRVQSALLIYTSGTTGAPKGVLLTQHNLMSNVQAALRSLPQRSAAHRSICLLPLCHVHGLVSDLLTPLLSGGTSIIAPRFALPLLERVEKALRQYHVQSFACVPAILEVIDSLGRRLPKTLEFCVSGGAPLSPELLANVQQRQSARIISAYGMTECTNYCTIMPAGASVPGSVGLPAGCSLRVVDAEGLDLEPGAVGEILVRGESVMPGDYYKRPDDASFVEPGHWFRTGDLGARDERNYLFIKGRKRNMAVRSGIKIYLDDLDLCLRRHPSVADAASVRLERQNDEEEVISFVVPRLPREASLGELVAHAEAQLGAMMRPDRLVLCETIPRTASHKVRIGELQALARSLP